MKTRLAIPILLVLAVLLGGCSGLTGSGLPTPFPTEYLPTVVALTAQAGQRTATASASLPLAASRTPAGTTPAASPVSGAATATPTPTYPGPSRTPTATLPQVSTATPTRRVPTPTPTNTRRPSQTPTITTTPGIPPADIQISTLGPMSKVVSPLEVGVTMRSVPGGHYVVELWLEPLRADEQPRLLLRELRNFSNDPAPYLYLAEEFEFELARLAEMGQFRISTYDANNRPVAVTAVDLLLLQVGENELTPAGDLLQPIIIREPAHNQLIQGGVLIVSGQARLSELPILNVELVAADGRVVGTGDIFLTPEPGSSHVAFESSLRYSVSEPTWVRLIIKTNGLRIAGIRQLASVEILLSP